MCLCAGARVFVLMCAHVCIRFVRACVHARRVCVLACPSVCVSVYVRAFACAGVCGCVRAYARWTPTETTRLPSVPHGAPRLTRRVTWRATDRPEGTAIRIQILQVQTLTPPGQGH